MRLQNPSKGWWTIILVVAGGFTTLATAYTKWEEIRPWLSVEERLEVEHARRRELGELSQSLLSLIEIQAENLEAAKAKLALIEEKTCDNTLDRIQDNILRQQATEFEAEQSGNHTARLRAIEAQVVYKHQLHKERVKCGL